MKAKLYALLLLASAMRLSAMQNEIVTEEPFSPFNYFDKEKCIFDFSFNLFIQVYARHLPTMRTYSAFMDGESIKGYYQEKGNNKEITLDQAKAVAVFSTLLKIDSRTPASEKRYLLDQLHDTITRPAQPKVY